MTRAVLRLAAATVAACIALLLGAAPAFAHTRLESSNPADGSKLDSVPATISLTFNEAVQSEFATLKVVGPDGTEYQTGAVSAANGQVSTAVSPLGPAGAYQVGYRVVSDDGHPVQGKLSFTLTTPGPAAAAPAATVSAAPVAAPVAAPAPAPAAAPVATQASTQQSEGAPIWPWLLGAVVLVGAGAVAALRLGRR
jgi:methionine-rich copper-binding protein CopC